MLPDTELIFGQIGTHLLGIPWRIPYKYYLYTGDAVKFFDCPMSAGHEHFAVGTARRGQRHFHFYRRGIIDLHIIDQTEIDNYLKPDMSDDLWVDYLYPLHWVNKQFPKKG